MQESINRAYYIVYFCGARRSRRFEGIPSKTVILICILAIWLAFLFGGSISFFSWNNGDRKSRAAQQTLNVRNVLSEVFVNPMPKITLARSLKINIGRRRKTQAAPKIITYLYKVVCFFFPARKLSFRIRRFIFCCPKQVSLFNGMTVLEQKMVNTSRHEILVVNVWTAQTGC